MHICDDQTACHHCCAWPVRTLCPNRAFEIHFQTAEELSQPSFPLREAYLTFGILHLPSPAKSAQDSTGRSTTRSATSTLRGVTMEHSMSNILNHVPDFTFSTTSTFGSIITAMLAALLALAGFSCQATAAYSRDLQVFPPVLGLSPVGKVQLTDSFVDVDVKQSGKPTCREDLITYTFGNSYGKPFVGEYQPPACSFNRVTWNMTVSVAGRQFDRLGTVFFWAMWRFGDLPLPSRRRRGSIILI